MNFIKVNTTYQAEVNDNKYELVIPSNAPIGEAYDVVFKFLSIIAEQAKVAASSIKPAEPDSPAQE